MSYYYNSTSISSRRRQKPILPLYHVTLVIGIILGIGSLFFMSSQYDLVSGNTVKLGLGTLITLCLTIATYCFLVSININIDWTQSDATMMTLFSFIWLILGYTALTQATLRYLNVKLDKSQIKVEEFKVKERHKYVHRGKRGTSYSYAIDVVAPDGSGPRREIKLHGQRELDKFEVGGGCSLRTKTGYFNCPYIVELGYSPAPKEEKPKAEKNNAGRTSSREASKSANNYRSTYRREKTPEEKVGISFRDDSYYSNSYSPSYKDKQENSDNTSSSKAFNRKLSGSNY